MKVNCPDNIVELKQQVIALCQQSQFNRAKELIKPFMQNNSADAELYALLGSINGELGEFEEAASCFSSCIKIQPSALMAYTGYGKSMLMLGRHSEAEVSLKKVLELNINYVPAYQELAKLYISTGDFNKAKDSLNRALNITPESEDLLLALGNLYNLWNKHDLAINYYNKLLEVNKDRVEAYHNLGRIYLNKAQVEKAEDLLNRAIKINNRYTPAYVDLGYLQLLLNRVDEAMSTYNKVLTIQPDNIDALIGRAKLYEQSGDIESVYKYVMPLIEKGVKHADIGLLYSKICRHYDCCESAVEYLESLLSKTSDAQTKDSKVHFALGTLYDSMGLYDKAFINFQKGNVTKADTFNAIEHTVRTDRLIEVCDWNFFMSAPRSTQQTERPVFIVGMPRSGSTLVEQILCSLPDVYGAGEIITLPGIVADMPKYLGSGSPYPDSLKNLTTEILDTLSSSYLNEINKLDKTAARVLDKTLVNFLYLGLISLMFPNARIIHCKRDPRDTCLSIYFKSFDDSHNYSTTLENLGHYYKEYEKLMKHWKSILNIPIFDVQYEDVVNDQEKLSRELIDFIGLEWDDDVLKFYENKRSVVTASYDQVRQKIYTNSTARWKNYEVYIKPLQKALNI